jgi:hypothetical protein
MPKQLILVFALLFQTLASDAQIVTKVYHKSEATCYWSHVLHEDYLLELFNDSTSKLSVYRSTSSNIKPPATITFPGTYSLDADTLKITYLSQPAVFENIISTPPLPAVLIVTDSSLQSPEKLIPALRLSSISVSIKLKNDFEKKLKQTTFSIPKKAGNAKLSLMQ